MKEDLARAARAYTVMALCTLATSHVLMWFPIEVTLSSVVGCILAARPGAQACALASRRRGLFVVLCAGAGLLVAFCTLCGWTIFFARAVIEQRSISWSAPLHIGSLIGAPTLVAMQSVWFCALYDVRLPRAPRVALWIAVPVSAVVLTLPALQLASVWWLLSGG